MSSINTYYNINGTSSSENQKNGSSYLGKDDFLKLLVTELRNQNPLEPMDSKEYIAQLAQFSSMEQMQNLNAQVASLSAVSAIGRTATALDDDGNEISGKINGVIFSNGKVDLIIGDDEKKIALENVIAIR